MGKGIISLEAGKGREMNIYMKKTLLIAHYSVVTGLGDGESYAPSFPLQLFACVFN